MSIALITGSTGLIGSEAVHYFSKQNYKIIGVDNDMRKYFFGQEASTDWIKKQLEEQVEGYLHKSVDIRDLKEVEAIFAEHAKDISVIIHTAAQPSHDWAAKEPFTDFGVNATGTLNLLEMARQHCPDAVFVYMSTNKVYGDRPNDLPLVENETRWELPEDHQYFNGIDETMSIDQCTHSLFGASKAAADLIVQEYGRYFGMKTGCFRGGCLTGPNHSGAQLHGFLSYLMKCCVSGQAYQVFGYKGKQVRDNIHSHDLIEALYHFVKSPKSGAVYNIGGGRKNNCSMLEAITLCEKISGKTMDFKIVDDNRIGDHMWYVSSLETFQKDYPNWQQSYTLEKTLQEIYDNNVERWSV